MVVGIDVTHPSTISGPDAPSMAVIVASDDESITQWPAELRTNPPKKEMVDHYKIKSMLNSRLEHWKIQKEHGRYSSNLHIYRDGVSEEQYPLVLHEELKHMREACTDTYGRAKQPPPKITSLALIPTLIGGLCA